ncbi:hypothetical protein BABINDRAFT_30589 [Babjeviella inositovora NRRL Y-12698]|uniref:AP complex subunit sigma n=1 Tax=Babjeviella inositovora NRRL Y-12698 TaxID=984486 RepID=A0A1E3QYH9_9ASCO|nr:uncharacterized protein BABINDRAFT_30589 [Babjeviella inositovora NRRL Y-12698]ODQ82730.1 hypothetical protein BABINDRAFT_30589 [Babjeviella inositovora NRRL Y-12698]
MTIQFIIVMNRQGRTRLAKWYDLYSNKEKSLITGQVHKLISTRDTKHQSNFVEFQGNKLVYRRYAGLFFIVSIAIHDSELAYLELLHFMVEILDLYFENVCELDLVFNFYKVYAILDELYLAGEIQETSRDKVLQRLAYLDKLD